MKNPKTMTFAELIKLADDIKRGITKRFLKSAKKIDISN